MMNVRGLEHFPGKLGVMPFLNDKVSQLHICTACESELNRERGTLTEVISDIVTRLHFDGIWLLNGTNDLNEGGPEKILDTMSLSYNQ